MLPLADEIRLLERAGFRVDVPWRRSPFAVIVGFSARVEPTVCSRPLLTSSRPDDGVKRQEFAL